MYKKRHRARRRIFCKPTTSKAVSGLVCADLLHDDDDGDNTKNLRGAVRHVSRSCLVSLPTGVRVAENGHARLRRSASKRPSDGKSAGADLWLHAAQLRQRWTDAGWTPRRNLTGHLLIALRGEREQKSAALRADCGGGGGVGGGRGGGGRGLHEMSREELIGWGRGGCRGYGIKTDPDVYIHSHCMWGG